MSALSLRGAVKVFHRGSADERVALADLTLAIDAGSFVVVIGSNGAGKSTLLNVIAGSLPLDAGSLAIGGQDVTRWAEHERASVIARVMQDPMRGTMPSLTIEENLALADMRTAGRGLRSALSPARRQRFADTLAGFGLGLENRLDARVGLLSGGQRQVLALAMAVLNPPAVLLLDEHCASLDPRTAELVMTATLRALQQTRITTLMITHNMQHAIRHGDRLLMMDAGSIRLDVAGAAKLGLTVESLVERFHLASDKMLLA